MFRRQRTWSAANPPGHSTHAVSRLQPVEDVYLVVTDRLVALHHRGQVPALRLAELSELAVTLLASGPQTQIYISAPDGGPPELLDPAIFQARREELRTMIRADLDRTVARGRH